jgi:carboxyl-terminal processing protease
LQSAQAASAPAIDGLLKEARKAEEERDYVRAWQKYTQILNIDRGNESVKEARHLCLRHILQTRRLRDRPSQADIDKVQHRDALKLYEYTLTQILKHHIDGEKVTAGDLFRNGVQEMIFALEDPNFLKENGLDNKTEVVKAFKVRLEKLFETRLAVNTLEDAVREFKHELLATGSLDLKPAIVLIEYLCGACNSLDDYTTFVTPRQRLEWEADMNGVFVGIGVDVVVIDGKLFVAEVYPNSPATGRVLKGDEIVAIDGSLPSPLTIEAAAARLQGESGKLVDLVLMRMVADSSDRIEKREQIERRLVELPNVVVGVADPMIQVPPTIGYIRVLGFTPQKTAHKLREAILNLPREAKVVILDLRGNLGGSFREAVQAAEMFLTDDVIVFTQTRAKETAHRAKNSDPFTMPLVILVDSDTASAAEVFAGALKDNGRAKLVGQSTYGKGSVQMTLPLDKQVSSVKSSIVLTVARWYSPTHVLYDGRGLVPDLAVEPSNMIADDLILKSGLNLAEEHVRMPPMRMPPPR